MTGELYEKHYDALLRYCAAMTGEHSDAEDLVQETFLRAMMNMDTLEELCDRRRGAWLKKTARNLFIDGLRRKSRETEEAAEPGRWDDYSEGAIMDAALKLPDAERTLFILRYVEGYNSSELGKLFGLPPATVRARLASARRKMQKLYFEGDR